MTPAANSKLRTVNSKLLMFHTTRRVEFGDTDMAGIMHFSNFFRFMEVAETNYLRARGLSVSWRRDGVKWGFPRVSAACDYKTPARFEDVLTIAVTVEKVGTKAVTYRYDFTNQHGAAVAVGRITAVYCRSDRPDHIESVEMPPDLRAKLEGPAA
jgi:acyl-CoA thioester hydrolase